MFPVFLSFPGRLDEAGPRSNLHISINGRYCDFYRPLMPAGAGAKEQKTVEPLPTIRVFQKVIDTWHERFHRLTIDRMEEQASMPAR